MAIVSSIVLAQQRCEIYFTSRTVAKPLWGFTTEYYWNRPPNLIGWIHPWATTN